MLPFVDGYILRILYVIEVAGKSLNAVNSNKCKHFKIIWLLSFKTCSCTDVTNLNSNVDSLWKTLGQLQFDLWTMSRALNDTKDQSIQKDGQIHDLMSQNSNLTALLANKDLLLKKSQVWIISFYLSIV